MQNAMFAAALAFSMGLKLEDIRHGLRTFDTTFFQAPGRMNIFDEHPFKVILDYGHNPAAVEAMTYDGVTYGVPLLLVRVIQPWTSIRPLASSNSAT